MKTYTLYTYSVTRKGRELLEIKEFPRPRFTKREYKGILIPSLYYMAGTGYEYSKLDAELFCDGKLVLSARCNTEADGPAITAYISVARPREKFHPLRPMIIAC